MRIHVVSVIRCLGGLFLLFTAICAFQPRTLSTSKHHAPLQSDCERIHLYLQSSASPKSAEFETAPDEESNDEDSDQTEQDVVSRMFEEDDKLSMPWSDVQDFALRDHLPRYTIMIPLNKKSKKEDSSSTTVYALWRTMLKEIPELAGYPIDFLQDMHARQNKEENTKSNTTPGLLPYLDDYEFAAAGGVSGKIYGVPGLADGTRIETSAVSSIEVTLPKGFVRCVDGSAAYELGLPKREAFSASATASAGKKASGELLNTVNNVSSMVPQTTEEADGMLLRLGASTAVLLAGATAINMLSHHMTVNVFWV